jgi:hypothetical protein
VKKIINFAGKVYISYFEGFFNMLSNLSTWGHIFNSPPKEAVPRFYRPQPGVNPGTLGPMVQDRDLNLDLSNM